jgi:hypothetical protein
LRVAIGGDLVVFGHGDDAGVDQSQTEVDVAFDQFHATLVVGDSQVDDGHVAGEDQAQEGGFGAGAEVAFDLPAGLGDDRGGDQELASVVAQELGAGGVVGVVGVSGGEQHAGVDHDAHRSRAAWPPVSSARISRWRRARSLRP